MLVRTYSKTNGLNATEVIDFLKAEYPEREWLGSSKLSSEEGQRLDRHFNIGDIPPQLPESQPETQQSPVQEQNQAEQPQEQLGQLQQLPQGQTTQLGELAQALQFVLSQQVSPSYSDGLKTEAATKEGAAHAYREFLAFQQGYSSTSQSLHQLNQALDVTRYQRASGQLDEVQRDFLSGLQQNSQNLQTQQQNHQKLVEQIKIQSQQDLQRLNDAVLSAIQDLNSKNS